jgi:hypothetical protein
MPIQHGGVKFLGAAAAVSVAAAASAFRLIAAVATVRLRYLQREQNEIQRGCNGRQGDC